MRHCSCKSDEVEEEPDCVALLEVAHSVGQVIGYMWYHYCPPSRAALFESSKTAFTTALENMFQNRDGKRFKHYRAFASNFLYGIALAKLWDRMD